MECKQCERYADKLRRIQSVIAEDGQSSMGRKEKMYETPHGRLIFMAAKAKNVNLAQLSLDIGYERGYVSKVCRGGNTLCRRSALLIGMALGIDLLPYVQDNAPTPPSTPPSGPSNGEAALPFGEGAA